MADSVAIRNYLALKKKSYAVKFDLENTDYTAIENIGTGAYGVVCSAVNNKTKQKVAIKKIPGIFGQLVIAKRTYREIKILKHFKHDNIIAIRDILHPGQNQNDFKDIYIVLDLMESDLHRIIYSKQDITEEHVRFFTYQILRGLKYVHSANVVHRDLKPSNLLVNENCDLKIGDFGMARGMSSNHDDFSMMMTHYVATRWYRAPELIILPNETYNEAVDMWSVGCILAEMLGRKQLFPGRSQMDQIERIIEKLGTPSEEYLKMASTEALSSFILKKGKIQGVSWSEVYPKASKKAIDLLSKMLVLEPRKRITVNQALKHPFLNKYHDPDDEPICIPVFNFDFDRKNYTAEELKAALMEEIMSYHKPKSCIQFNFQPVPKSALNQISSHQPETKSGKDVTNNNELSNKRSPEHDIAQESSSSCKSDGSFERRHSELVQQLKDLQELQESNTVVKSDESDEAVFKKPEGFPLSVKMKEATAKCMVAEPRNSSSDVEMYSAKTSSKTEMMNVSVKSEAVSDIEMISAGHNHVKEMLNPAAAAAPTDANPQPSIGEPKTLDAKGLIRKKIAENERRKQREGEMPAKTKPMTAIQKQREREEKRRQKLVKAKLKRKKEMKDKSSTIELSEEDRKLLEKWKNMQEANKTNINNNSKPDPIHGTDSVMQSVANIVIQAPNPSNSVPLLSQQHALTEAAKGQQPVPGINLQAQTTINTIPVNILPASQGLPNAGNFASTQNTASSLISHSTGKVATLTQSAVTVGSGSVSSASLPIAISEANASAVPLSNVTGSQAFGRPESVPFGSYDQWLSTSHPSTTHIRLPSYSEALQAKLSQSQPWLPKSQSSPQLGIIQTFASAIDPRSAGQGQWPASDQTSSKQSLDIADKTESDLKVITKQLKQSNVEDLTLTHTPKGTGGGYGVASDMDLLMGNSPCDQNLEAKSDSAQLSPSLFTDWQDLTGCNDPREFYLTLNEYMKSPISSQELNNVILSLMSPKSSKIT